MSGLRLRTVVRSTGYHLVRVPRYLLAGTFRLWQLVVSPWYGPTCRFYPSCSTYGVTAVMRHGLVRGGWLTIRRLVRCHPWNPGGVDHVPPVTGRRAASSDSHGLDENCGDQNGVDENGVDENSGGRAGGPGVTDDLGAPASRRAA